MLGVSPNFVTNIVCYRGRHAVSFFTWPYGDLEKASKGDIKIVKRMPGSFIAYSCS